MWLVKDNALSFNRQLRVMHPLIRDPIQSISKMVGEPLSPLVDRTWRPLRCECGLFCPIAIAQSSPVFRVDRQGLYSSYRRKTDEGTVIRDRPVSKRASKQGESVIGQRRIDERFLPVEGFRCATTREAISVKIRLDHFGEEFGNRAEPEPVAPIPSIQRLSEHILPTVGVVTQVQPVIHFAPIFRALCDGRSCLTRVDTADYDVHAVQAPFHVKPFGNSLP